MIIPVIAFPVAALPTEIVPKEPSILMIAFAVPV